MKTEKKSISEIVDKLKNKIEEKKNSQIDISPYLKQSSLMNTKTTPSLKILNSNRENFYLFTRRVGKYLQRRGFYRVVSLGKKILDNNTFHYDMSDFIPYYNEEFIQNAFRKILQREANTSEQALYLSLLESGEKSKTEIIILLRFSKEGRDKNLKILGIKKRYWLFKLYKLPIIGYLFKSLYILGTLPKLIKRINSFENHIKKEVTLKADEKTLITIQNELDNKKVNIVDMQMPPVPDILEIKANDFLLDAKNNFPYPLENLDRFKKDELYYSMFESTFYNHKVVLEKQKIYLNYMPKNINTATTPHLDIGCGRGELLTILENNNYKTIGIDINSLEIKHLGEQGFTVEHREMIDFLQTTPQIFSSISALQVIEHIDHDTLKKFISLSYEKIETGGVIMLETINPHNPVAFNSFHMDETHTKPLPPEMVAFMLQYIGFKDVKFIFISPMHEEFRSRIDERINYHDYAVIGYKK